jgi:hypothetical protein
MADQVYRNVGELFEEERFSQISEYQEWSSEKIEQDRRKLEELLEKRETQLEEGLAEMETRYFWVSYVLRALGYCYSVAEMTPDATEAEEPRPDFTLFEAAEDFSAALPYRGEREFFVHSLAIMRGLAWDASLDEVEEEEGPLNPAFEVDRFIRATGVEWGILTNGRKWRLFHRDTVGLMDTYYEVDLIAALEAGDTESFKYFWMVFSPEALAGYGEVEPLVRRMLH